MKNIAKIFLSDVKRLGTNVVAVVIILGLSILPSLYAWFNILSNWDPYGPDSTSKMAVAVASDDVGIELAGMEMNVGDTVVEALKENDTIGWVFTETTEDAIAGVTSGEYYAALVIPEDFTEDMISFFNGEIENPTINYYENEKKNAIAPKITSKAQKAVKEQVNATFVSTVAEYVVKATGVVSGEGEDGDNISALNVLLVNMNELDSTLNTYLIMLDSFINITDSANSLLTTTQTMLPNIGSMVEGSQSTVNTLQAALVAADGSVNAASTVLSATLQSAETSLSSVRTQINMLMESAKLGLDVSGNVQAMSTMIQAISDSMNDINVDDFTKTWEDADKQKFKEQYSGLQTNLNALSTDVATLSTTIATTENDINTMNTTIQNELDACIASIRALEDTYNYSVKPQIDNTVNDTQLAMIEASAILNSINSDFSDVSAVLQQYKDSLTSGNQSLRDSRDMAQQMKDGLEDYIGFFTAIINDEQYQDVIEMLQADPSLVSSFVSSPVSMETVEIFPVENYGSAASPFYTILAIWFGSLILVAILKVKVLPIKSVANMKPYQAYFGRYIVFFLIGQAQTLLTVLGNLLFINIQCHEPFLYWLACAVCSFVFTFFIYSLTFAFENIGEALAVVIMVIQVAGAGGTFPIQCLPVEYQMVYKYLPFVYGMNALKECIGGMYKLNYLKDLMILLAFIGISLIIGLVLSIPVRRLNEKIEESKERTGVML